MLRQLLEDERARRERLLATARVVVLVVAALAAAGFVPWSPGDDAVVQWRAVAVFGLSALVSACWLWWLPRLGVGRWTAPISSTLDCLVVALVVLNWSLYPHAGFLPHQLKFGVGYGMFLSVIILTGLRFHSRSVMLVTGEVVAAYGGLAWLVANHSNTRFVLGVAESQQSGLINIVDVLGRFVVLLVAGALMTLVVYRGECLVERAVLATEQKARLRQFVSTNLATALESGQASLDLSGQRRRITILFSDIRGFTELSERVEPEALLALLNGYYEVVTAEIARHGGTVDKYVGDGVMALFGAPFPLENSSVAAVRCAHGMLRAVADYGQRVGQPLHIGVGLHTAEVVVGNLGTEAYKNYTAVGAGVNLAARIESATRAADVSLLFSEAVSQDLGAGASRLVGRYELKGIAGAVPLFTSD